VDVAGGAEDHGPSTMPAVGGGTAGQNFGTSGGWNVIHKPDADGRYVDFRTALDSPGSNDMQHQFALYDSLPWFDLMPSGMQPGFFGRDLVAQGQGDGLSYIAAAGTADHRWLLAYVPPGTDARSFGVDLAAMAGPTQARWYNPTGGTYTLIAGGLDNAGVGQFTTRGDNGTGTNDWVLVLDAG
jgi:hypothetical protein